MAIMAEKKKKTITQDMVQQFINEATPYLVNFLYGFIPASIKEKCKGKRMAQMATAALSVAIAKITPDGGIWDYVDEFRAEFLSTLGRLLTEGKLFGISPGGPAAPFSSPEIQQAVNAFQEAVRRANLFVIDEEPRARILEWIALLPEEEQVAAMEMVQALSIKEIKRFGQTDHDQRNIFWKAHSAHPKNQPEKKPSRAEVFFKEMNQALENFSKEDPGSVNKKLEEMIERSMEDWKRERENRKTRRGFFISIFRIF